MTWLLLNVPLMIVFFALWVGIPLWMVRTHGDTPREPATAAAVRALRQRSDRDEAGYRRVA